MPNNVERLRIINVDIHTEIYRGLAVHHSLPLAAHASSCDQIMSFAYAIPVPTTKEFSR